MDTAEVINKMIDDILNGDNTEAEEGFNSALASKVSAALDDRKVELAQALYRKQDDEISQEDSAEETIDAEADTEEEVE